MRTPEQERTAIIGLYNRYCIRCHGVDGRGIWDIPGVPDFSNPRFQASLSDPHMVASIIEGRGAVMPPFRGTLTLEEACSMARYLRTFVPGTEISRPDVGTPPQQPSSAPAAAPAATTAPPPPPLPGTASRGAFAR
jgi:mono/diheme cytochrome c family protein